MKTAVLMTLSLLSLSTWAHPTIQKLNLKKQASYDSIQTRLENLTGEKLTAQQAENLAQGLAEAEAIQSESSFVKVADQDGEFFVLACGGFKYAMQKDEKTQLPLMIQESKCLHIQSFQTSQTYWVQVKGKGSAVGAGLTGGVLLARVYDKDITGQYSGAQMGAAAGWGANAAIYLKNKARNANRLMMLNVVAGVELDNTDLEITISIDK